MVLTGQLVKVFSLELLKFALRGPYTDRSLYLLNVFLLEGGHRAASSHLF